MNNNKKPGEPLETEDRALEDVPVAQLVDELVNRDGIESASDLFCLSDSYNVTIRLKMNKEDCPECLR